MQDEFRTESSFPDVVRQKRIFEPSKNVSLSDPAFVEALTHLGRGKFSYKL